MTKFKDTVKICEYCGSEFITTSKKQFLNKRCCSQSCSNKLMWRENRTKMLESHRTDAARARNSNSQKKKWADPEYKQKMHVIKKRVASLPESKAAFVKRIHDWSNSADHVQEFLDMRQEIANRPDVKKQVSTIHKKLWSDPTYREKMSKKFSEGQLRRWSNVESMEKSEQSHGTYKDYYLPSGRAVRIQGYEPQALDSLLLEYEESDIVIGVKNINNTIGKILYVFDNKERRYYPDFYIKSTNTIIEVKSQWTFDKCKEKNLAKEQACLEQGFNFEFMIL